MVRRGSIFRSKQPQTYKIIRVERLKDACSWAKCCYRAELSNWCNEEEHGPNMAQDYALIKVNREFKHYNMQTVCLPFIGRYECYTYINDKDHSQDSLS